MRANRARPLVVHVTYSLKTGGLENGLVNLINNTSDVLRHAIICLAESGNFVQRLQAPVPIHVMNKQPGTDPGMYWRLARLMRKLQPDIVHTRNIAALATVPCSLVVPGVKRIHGEHGRDMRELTGQNRKYNLLRKGMRPWIDKYIAVSMDLQQWLINTIHIHPEKICQIYNGVDGQRFCPATDPVPPAGLPWDRADKPLVIGTVGRLARVKNQQLLLKAYAVLRQQQQELFAGTRLLVVGDGPQAKEYQELCAGLGLNDQVIFTGNRDDIPQLLRQMDIFVLPSLAEGISNTILEAMATGVPVIATDTGGTPELISDGVNGFLVPADSPEIMAARAGELIADSALRQQLGRAGREMVKNRFTWQQSVNNYLALYRELLELD